MAYSINPNLPKARAFALKSLLLEELPVGIVAIRSGVHRTTIWHWKQKWIILNKDRQLDNPNRPTRPAGKGKLAKYRWNIVTEPSKPSYRPWAVARHVIDLVLAVRAKLKRCAEVVWHHLVTVLFIVISLGSVRRILKRNHCSDRARKNRVRSDNPQRPVVTKPSKLIQTDTIHQVDPKSGRQLYYYTVIDLYTRMTYVSLYQSSTLGMPLGRYRRHRSNGDSLLLRSRRAMDQSTDATSSSRCKELAYRPDTAGCIGQMTLLTLNGLTGPSMMSVLAITGNEACHLAAYK